jgi:hypothetical protein
MRTILISPVISLCLLCGTPAALAYEGEEYPESNTHVEQPYVEETYTEESHPQETYPEETYPDESYPQETYPEESYPDGTGAEPDYQGDPAYGGEPQNLREAPDPLQEIRTMCFEYANDAGLPEEEKAAYVEECIQSQSY